ncbi:MAG: hypothetical protein FWC97_05520 [Treponema sp.]|nr:hypothetical protein [Treponema sp.]
MKKTAFTNKPRILRLTMLAGIFFLLICCIALLLFVFIERGSVRTARRQENFNNSLRQFDIAFSDNFGTEREFEYFNRALDRLENNTITVESWLSVLKRRRTLSALHPPSLTYYRNSLNNALNAFPASQHIIALAAAQLVKDTAITRETETLLRRWLPLLNRGLAPADSALNTIALSFHVLLGDFRNPALANQYVSSGIVSCGTEAITINLALLKVLRENIAGASADIQTMTASWDTLSTQAAHFAAEFTFDFGDLIRSAELFSQIDDTRALIRQADALYLAGFRESAAFIWNLLAISAEWEQGEIDLSETPYIENSLYNLASLALADKNYARAHYYLGRLVRLDSMFNSNSHIFGLIRYSRLYDMPEAASVIESNINIESVNSPYVDLEIVRRYREMWHLNRQIAETWLLLDRHPENENLNKWAAWHFFFQRRFDEIPIFMDRLNTSRFADSWTDLYRALLHMNDGDLEAAEAILLNIPEAKRDWTVWANLGRIYETQRSPARALAQYELAAANMELSAWQNPEAAARIQHRIARCLITLGRPAEAIRALLLAVELDPNNLSAQLELDRLLF